MDILSGILLLKSASLHFVLPAFFLIAIVEILRDSSIAQVVQTLAESVQHIFSSGNYSRGKSHRQLACNVKEMLDYPSIILWVLELAEMATSAFAAGSAAADVGMGLGGALEHWVPLCLA